MRFLLERIERRLLLTTSGPLVAAHDTTGVSSQLLQLVAAHNGGAANALAASGAKAGPYPALSSVLKPVFDSSGRVEVDITAKNVTALEKPLAALKFKILNEDTKRHLFEGFLPTSTLNTIGALSAQGMLGVTPVYQPLLSAGKVDAESDFVLSTDRVRALAGDTGAGVTVGALSDSYNDLGTAAADVTSGDLPNNVNVLQDLSSGGEDEGRGMLQIIHDEAPGASLAFATADNGESSFAANITNLAKPVSSGGAGAKVITDDVVYLDEPFFQDGIVAQAVTNAVTTYGASYFSAAGNYDHEGFDSANGNFYSDTISGISSSAQNYYNFNGGGTNADKNTFSLSNSQAVLMTLEWNSPYYTSSGVTNDLDIYILNHTTGAVVASSTSNNISSQSPYEIVSYQNSSGTTASYDVVIRLASGAAPSRVRFVNYGSNSYGDVSFAYGNNAPALNPHAGSANAMAVAAAPFYLQRTPENFTSMGPTTIYFSPTGTSLGTPVVRAKPDITGIDGESTTFFGSPSDYNGFPNFFGTSAAAPSAAGVAALIQQVNPGWTPAQVYADMKATADPNIGGTPGNANLVGAGLIDAYRAVLAATPTPASLPYSTGFEAGGLDSAWTTYASGGRADVLAGNTPYAGTYQLIEDGDMGGYIVPNLNEAILNFNYTGTEDAVLSFEEKPFANNYETTQAMPTSFTGHGNYDGVAFSVNGTTWYRVTTLNTSTSSSAFTPYSFDLSTLAASDGVTLSSDTQIKFQHYDPDALNAPTGGIGIDNVSVTTPLPAWLNPNSIATWNATTHVLNVTGAATIIADPGSDEPLVEASGAAAVVTINPASGTDIHIGGLSLAGGASASVTSLGAARTISNYRLLVVGVTGATVAPLYTIDSTSKLDLTNNDMAILYGTGTSPLSTVTAQLSSAYDNKLWDKPGLTSSAAQAKSNVTALGFGEASTLGLTTFDGLTLGGNAVLVKYTLIGDTFLKGSVGLADYNKVIANLNVSGLTWTSGVYDYTNTVGLNDYNDVLANFNQNLANELP